MLTINKVSKKYNTQTALNNISLTIPKGSCYGLVGPNGAGKSTLLKIIASVIQADKGNVFINHKSPHQKEKLNLGYIPQEICLEQTVSALQNLYFFGKLYGLTGKHLRKRADEVLMYVGLDEHGEDKVLTFSGGMKRRLNIGCALMNQPSLIIMDEPTVGIDPQSRRYIFNMIEQLKQESCTIIYASHYMEEVEQICDYVAFIDQSEIIEADHISRIVQKHASPSVFVKGINNLPDHLKALGTIVDKKAGLLITTHKPLLVMEEILQHCKTNGQMLERLELVNPRLEDIFFSLTGMQLRD